MDYESIYHNFINSRINLQRIKNNDGKLESHHILPQSFGGSNEKQNIILLTPREHYFAHLLLYKMHSGKNKAKMAYALFKMCNNNQNQTRLITSRQYEYAKLQMTLSCSGKNHPTKGKQIHSLENRKKFSEQKMGIKNPMFGKPSWNSGKKGLQKWSSGERMKISKRNKGRKFSEEIKKKMSLATKGKPKSLEHRKKLSMANIGKKMPDYLKNKLIQINKTRPQIDFICPHCQKSGKGSAMFRWHFDNCKSKII